MENVQPAYLVHVDIEGACALTLGRNAVPDYWGWVRSTFAGRRLPDDWKIFRHEVDSPKGALRDFVSGYSDAPFVAQRVVDTLADKLDGVVEFRKVGCIKKNNYYALNVIKVLECVDETQSRILKNEDGSILLMDRVVFLAEKREEIKSLPIFKVPEDLSKVFATDLFVNWVRQFRFTGIEFLHAENPGLTRCNSVFSELPFR